MHRHHQSKPGYYRGWFNAGLPENPICWLFGHRPRPVITEWKFMAPSLWIDCRTCGRRYADHSLRVHVEKEAELSGKSFKQVADELTARRIENARRDPKAFVSGVERRTGWSDRSLELHHEVMWPARGGKKRRGRDFAVKLHVGDQHSETPFDGHVQVGPFAYFWSIGGIGHRLASLIGGGHKRDLSLSMHGGHLWWKVWYDDDGGSDVYHDHDTWKQPRIWPWSRGYKKRRAWMCLRDGNIEVNPLDALWGRARPERVKVGEKVTLAVPVGEFPGDTYLLDVQLEKWTWARVHGPDWARRVTSVHHDADWRCDPGIPVRNHDWKGDEILGSSVRLPDPLPEDWQARVVAEVIEQVKRDRRRYDYTPPQERV